MSRLLAQRHPQNRTLWKERIRIQLIVAVSSLVEVALTAVVPEADRRCMLFSELTQSPELTTVHGGGYYMGSINTHHYFVWRLAKKIRGRVFAVNYRSKLQPCC